MSTWKCKKHSIAAHDVFINYRVKTEKDLAQKLFYALSSETKSDGKAVSVYLDVMCLNDGEDWEVGFLNGLENAALIVLLISEDGIAGIKDADKWQDNVLLEYEYALEKHEKKQAMILPLLVGKNLEGGLFKQFGAFNTDVYPEAKHFSDRSSKSIRETMKSLFRLQGIKTHPDYLQDKLRDVLKAVETALTNLNRLGPKKEEKSDAWKSTPAKKWSIDDVQSWLTELGLDELKPSFKQNAVDGSIIMDFSEQDFRDDLKVTNKIFLRKLMIKINELKAAPTPTPIPTPTSVSSGSSSSSTSSGSVSSTDFKVSAGTSHPKLSSKAVQETWEGNFKKHFTKVITFEYKGEPYFWAYDDKSTGQWEIRRLSATGEPSVMQANGWTCNWDQWCSFSRNGVPYYLCSKSSDGRVEVGTFEGGANPKTLYETTWSTGWTHFVAYHFNKIPYIVIYKTGEGRAEICRIEEDGNITETWTGVKWAAGWTSLVAFTQPDGSPALFIYNRHTGEYEIQKLSAVAEAFYKGTTEKGFTTFMALNLKGFPFIFAENAATGETWIAAILGNGTLQHKWGAGWSTGWDSYAAFHISGIQYYVGLKSRDGRAEVGRIQHGEPEVASDKPSAPSDKPSLIGKVVKETWEGRWSSGWSHAATYEYKGVPRMAIYKVKAGNFETVSLEETKEPKTLKSESWSTGWDTFITYQNNGNPWYLIAKSGDGRVEVGTFEGESGEKVVTKYESKWTTGWTHFVVYEYNGKFYTICYKVGGGNISVCEILSNGELKESWGGSWTTGWSSWVVYREVSGENRLLIYKVGDGRIETCRLTDKEPTTLWAGSFPTGFTTFSALSLNKHPFVMISSAHSGVTQISSINESGYIDEEWSTGWSSGWSTRPSFQLDGRQYYFAVKEGEGRVEIARIQYA